MTLINVNAGTDFTEDAVALDNYIQFGAQIYNPAGSILPQLNEALPPVSQVITAGAAFTSSWTAGTADPVSAVLMHSNVMNEFVLDTGTKSGTDWVVTFPTKRYYVNVGTGNAPKLFQRNFNQTDGSCDDVSLNIYDREERTTSTPVGFSPPPPTQTNSICWEANVVTFNNSNVLGSSNSVQHSDVVPERLAEPGLPDGHLGRSAAGARAGQHDQHVGDRPGRQHHLRQHGDLYRSAGRWLRGADVQQRCSAAPGPWQTGAGNVLSNYGGNFIHKYQTIDPLTAELCFRSKAELRFRLFFALCQTDAPWRQQVTRGVMTSGPSDRRRRSRRRRVFVRFAPMSWDLGSPINERL